MTTNCPHWPLSFPLPLPLGAVTGGVDLCTSHRLLVTFPETEGSFRGLTGPVLPQPVPPALGLQPELLLGKPGPTPYFWECRSSGAPGFPLHGPLTGQYELLGGWQCGEPKNCGCLDVVTDKPGANISKAPLTLLLKYWSDFSSYLIIGLVCILLMLFCLVGLSAA